MLKKLQKEILDGAMLGDGCLYLHKKCKNACLTYTSVYKDHVEYIASHFQNDFGGKVKFSSSFDTRTNKTYSRYTFRSRVHPVLTKNYYRWYSNGKKIIPKDLILTPSKCLVWYIGDGHLNKEDHFIKLSTNCFSKNDLEKIVLPQMKVFKPRIYLDGTQPLTVIPRINVKKFLNYIGNCPVQSYSYKWDYIEYKTKKFENGIELLTQKEINRIIKLYKTGIPYYKIGKDMGYEPARIRHVLKKEGCYIKGRDKLVPLFTKERIKEIFNKRIKGKSWAELEKEYNFKKGSIYYYIKKYNI